MATIITYRGAKIQEIIDGTVVDGNINAEKHLILEQRDGTTIDAGLIDSPKGMPGSERALAAGQIELYAGTYPPVGWTWCDGSEQSRTEYPELFAAIGTKYGAGDGTTTFNLPDFGGRVGVGMDSTQTEFNDLGVKGGEKAHTLTVNELPSHKHTVLGYAGVDDKNFSGNLGRLQASDTSTPKNLETASTGGDQAHNNIQPYIALTHIISTGKASGSQGGGGIVTRAFTYTRRGTTAQRDALYGVPSTMAARVALANQQVTWFNTDLGWKERYYEIGSSSGLTVRGLFLDASSGWYPIGDGPAPYIELEALAEVSQFFNTYITGWSIRNRKGGASWFTLSGTDRVNMLKPGRYDVKAFTNQLGDTSLAPDYSLQLLDTDNSTVVRLVGGGAFAKFPGLMTRPHQELYDQYILANQKIAWKLQRGTMSASDTTMQIHTGDSAAIRGRLSIKYLAPPLNDLS